MSTMRFIRPIFIALLGFVAGCASQSYSKDVSRPDEELQPSSEQSDPDRSTASMDKSVVITLRTGNRPLGAYSVLLRFHSDRAELQSVSDPPGNQFQSPFHRVITDPTSPTSTVRIASFEIDRALSGTVSVAEVTFTSSSSPSSFIRDLRIETISDPDGNRIDADVSWRVRNNTPNAGKTP